MKIIKYIEASDSLKSLQKELACEFIYKSGIDYFDELIKAKGRSHFPLIIKLAKFEEGYLIRISGSDEEFGVAILNSELQSFSYSDNEEYQLNEFDLGLAGSVIISFFYNTSDKEQIFSFFDDYDFTDITEEQEDLESMKNATYKELLQINASNQPEKDIDTGSFYIIGGVFLIIITVFIYLYKNFYSRYGSNGFAGLATLILFYLYIIRKGIRHTVKSFDEVIKTDKRDPIVYLRSFDDDHSEKVLREVNHELVLSKVIKPYGPLLAIGKPGESLPTLGANRKYVSDEDWENVVTKMLAIAKAVIFKLNSSSGLLKEYELALKTVPYDKILFYFPEMEKDQTSSFINEFNTKTKYIFPNPLPGTVKPNSFLIFNNQLEFHEIGVFSYNKKKLHKNLEEFLSMI